MRWLRAAEDGALASGIVSAEDLARWCSRFDDDLDARPPLLHDERRRARVDRWMTTTSPLPPAGAHRFRVGARVTVKRWHDAEHHHRCPRYVRGVDGVVETAWGDEPVPGDEARSAPTYTVSFASTDLWGDGGEAAFTVSVDLCEEYLEPAP